MLGVPPLSARLNQAHRVTDDVGTVDDGSMPPDAVNALLLLDDTRPDPTATHRACVSGNKVEILGTGQWEG